MPVENRWDQLESAADGLAISRDVSLRRFSSLGIGGQAAGFVSVDSEPALSALLERARKMEIPVKILGGGTNLVFTDQGFSGLLIRLGEGFKKIEIDQTGARAGAGAHLTALITRAIEAGLAGVEKLAGIPGTLGGAIYQNSGARDYETAQAVESVTFYDATRRRIRTLPKSELGFGYRTSVFHKMPAVILSAQLALEPAPRERLAAEVSARMKHRTETQPTGRSVGCIFKNPEGASAGHLIDQAGLKGRRAGGLVVSDIHGNFFINRGGAAFGDFEELVATVRETVRNKFGVNLELEVEVVREKTTGARGQSGAAETRGCDPREAARPGEPPVSEDRALCGWILCGEGNFV